MMCHEWCNVHDIYSIFRAAQNGELWAAIIVGTAVDTNRLFSPLRFSRT